MFRYRKLYADLVSDAGEVCIAYVASLELFGMASHSAGYEYYAPDGSRHVVRGSSRAEVRRDARGLSIAFTTQHGPFSYQLSANTDARATTRHEVSRALTWQVLSHASPARIAGIFGVSERSGAGYADQVEMTEPPRKLGLAELFWGRGGEGGRGFVFTRARFHDGRTFQSALVDGSESSALILSQLAAERFELRSGPASFQLQDERVIHAGPALDRARFPGRAERWLARALSGPMEEVRALARFVAADGSRGFALHERVQFGS
jgi:hypothetical protein